MTPHAEAACAQLTDELGARLRAIAILDTPDAVLVADEQAERIADRTMSAVMSTDQREAAQAVIDIACALWPSDIPADWWPTPLGRLCAASLAGATPSDESVRPSVAARMLGVSHGRVTALANEGKLDRHPDGAILLASVYARLGG